MEVGDGVGCLKGLGSPHHSAPHQPGLMHRKGPASRGNPSVWKAQYADALRSSCQRGPWCWCPLVFILLPPCLQPWPQHPHHGEGAAVCMPRPCSPVWEKLLWQRPLRCVSGVPVPVTGVEPRLPGACSLAFLPWFTGARATAQGFPDTLPKTKDEATAALRGRVAAITKGAWLLS